MMKGKQKEGMQIPLTKELKVELLQSLSRGYLDLISLSKIIGEDKIPTTETITGMIVK